MGQTGVILLDTHVVAWLAFEPARISAKARAAIDDARKSGDGLAICDITLFELAALARKGRIRLGISIQSFLEEIEARFVVLPMSGRTCARAVELPAAYPRDPADRVIGATALVEGLPLITADRNIRRSKIVRTVW
ncbi:MAG TPA: type II toxin-antitoxin system VapC family toxin [Candidatus Acidoferrales bacterium]|nr:type II toxin-antitoxin system VapC family toxin [Candidatus Acidoferrales bacterium]